MHKLTNGRLDASNFSYKFVHYQGGPLSQLFWFASEISLSLNVQRAKKNKGNNNNKHTFHNSVGLETYMVKNFHRWSRQQ